jgi:hypothetical protein
MVRMNRQQRVALKRLHDRMVADARPSQEKRLPAYREFRRTVKPVFAGDGAVIVQWSGMWVGIEPDGYTHT